MRSLIFGVLIFCLLGACYASQDDDSWKRLENANKARDLYVHGESAYKAGLWEAAARYWQQALELKPDSDYTAKMLREARRKLSADYEKRVDTALKGNDRLTAYLLTRAAAPLVGKESVLNTRLGEIEGKLTPDDVKARDAYDQAIEALTKKDYPGAWTAIQQAQTFARKSAVIADAATQIKDVYDKNKYTVTALPHDLYTTRDFAFDNYWWQHIQSKTLSIPVNRGSSVNLDYRIYELHGTVRCIATERVTDAVISARIKDKRTGDVVDDVRGHIPAMSPGEKKDFVFTRPSGGSIKLVTTVRMRQHHKELETEVSATKSQNVKEEAPVRGYACADDKETIADVYDIVAYSIVSTKQGTGEKIEQRRPDVQIKQNYQ